MQVLPRQEDELHAPPAAFELVGQDRRLRDPQYVLTVLLPEPVQHPEPRRVEASPRLGEPGKAIANKDVDTILSISTGDVVCTSPIGQTTGIERFRAFHDGFARMLTSLTVLAVYGDDTQAVVVYDAAS
jgi:hypothetical protein